MMAQCRRTTKFDEYNVVGSNLDAMKMASKCIFISVDNLLKSQRSEIATLELI